MRVGLTASSLLHAGVIVLGLVSFSSPHAFEPPVESLPVDIVSASEFSQMTKGAKTAPRAEKPKQLAEKVDAPKPVENPEVKVSTKEEVNPTAPPPAPTPPPQPQPQPKAEEKPPVPPKAPEPAKPEPQKADESLKPEPKKEEPKPEAKPVQAQAQPPAPLPPKKPPPPKPNPTPTPDRSFSADQIQQLLDKRTPQRQASAAPELSNSSSLGTTHGQAAALSQSEIDAFRARMRQCWNPIGVPSDQGLFVIVVVSFKLDGTLAREPEVRAGAPSAYGPALSESAVRALIRCQPYTMLRREKYDQWREMELKFTPQMFDG